MTALQDLPYRKSAQTNFLNRGAASRHREFVSQLRLVTGAPIIHALTPERVA
jgi:hypothetical protein